ncbi:hypothetical protein PpBr36_03820 [Pyricularia pennisetigena]|uniref:hypothetical protein n=1 Tax=Pyricularia pennisetigena TaxID=1578925 RepID=UPI00114F3F9A|nr:hypothetical protein PpBr36_03820 [Pyricularia pennisetigena]TLS30323.1 hypothetical protein PpBr36_03820 [Pyricularia pennisetigena]
MAPHGYALRSRMTPQNLQNEATCKDHKPAAAPKVIAGPSTVKLSSPSPENHCNYEPKRVAHLRDKRAAYFIDNAFRLLRPRLVPHDHPVDDEEVLIPLREGVGAPVVPMRRKLIRMGLHRTGVTPGGDPTEVLDEIVVGGAKVSQEDVSHSDQDNGSKAVQEDDRNSEQAAVQAGEAATNTAGILNMDNTIVAGTITDENDGYDDDNDSHTEVESEAFAAELELPFKDTPMADGPGAQPESPVVNESMEEEDETVVAASIADQNGGSDDDELTEVEPEAPVAKARLAHDKSPIEDVTMVDAQEIDVKDTMLGQDTEVNLQAVAEHEESIADASIAKTSVSVAPTSEATVADTHIAEKPQEHTTAGDISMTEAREINTSSTVKPNTTSSWHTMAELGESIMETAISEALPTRTPSKREPVAKALMADVQVDFTTSPATADVAAPRSSFAVFSSSMNPTSEPTNPADSSLLNPQLPLPQSRQSRPVGPTQPSRHSLPSEPTLIPHPPRPPPPLFHEVAPRLPLPPPPSARPAPTATTVSPPDLPREYDDITGYEHGDTPETYYLPFAGDADRTRVHLTRRAENIKRANREARPSWRG